MLDKVAEEPKQGCKKPREQGARNIVKCLGKREEIVQGAIPKNWREQGYYKNNLGSKKNYLGDKKKIKGAAR